MSPITITIYHNSVVVLVIHAYVWHEEEIDNVARMMCERRGGIVSVHTRDDEAEHPLSMWEFSYINSDGRVWRVSQDDMWEWEDKWEMSDIDDTYLSIMQPQERKSRLEMGKWLIMGDDVRYFLPSERHHHKRVQKRKERRNAQLLIQEQLSLYVA